MFSQALSFLLGVYVAQEYDIPRVKKLIQDFQNKLKDNEKK